MASGLPSSIPSSAIRDNHRRGTVADFLRPQLKPGADLDLVDVDAIFASFQHRRAAELQRRRQFILPTLDEQVRPDSAFELVTWLVILEAGQPQ